MEESNDAKDDSDKISTEKTVEVHSEERSFLITITEHDLNEPIPDQLSDSQCVIELLEMKDDGTTEVIRTQLNSTPSLMVNFAEGTTDHTRDYEVVNDDNIEISEVNYDEPSASTSNANLRQSLEENTDSDKTYIPENDEDATDCESLSDKEVSVTVRESAIRNLDESLNVEFRPKKRQRNEANWVKNKRKRVINSGMAYTTTGGRQREAKKVGPACGDKCKLKCSTFFSVEQRQSIFNKYYAVGDRTRQRNFLNKCMIITTPRKYRRETTRKLNYAYYLFIDGRKKRVCKYFFKNTLAINNTVISTVQTKTDSEGMLDCEGRGSHSKHKRLPDAVKQSVRDHINSFPRIESHYCRADSSREYLEGDLNISIMYRLYIEYCQTKEITPAKMSMYTHIFNTEFNIAFFKPKKDQCSKCEAYKNAPADKKSELQEEYDVHIKEKNTSRNRKQEDIEKAQKSDGKILVCDYDLQAVVPLPKGEISTFYYKSKLNFINFTVCEILNKKGVCYCWHEGQAKRGANEIGTCVYLFLSKLGEMAEVIFYSDNCGGQNKNKFILTMYMYAVRHLPITTITHNFLITGHTQNHADNIHSVIEREKKRVLKSGPIYTPAQMAMVLKSAKKTGESYSVHEMNTEDFKDWKDLTSQMGKNFKTDEEGNVVNWGAIRTIKVTKESPFRFSYKTSFSNQNEAYKIVNTRKRQRGNIGGNLKPAYFEAPFIAEHKKKDLMSLCDSNLIPSAYRAFYESLKTKVNPNDDSDNSD